MFVECPECSARKYVFIEPPHGKKYYCHKCGIKYIVSVPKDETDKKSRIMLRCNQSVQRVAVIASILLFLIIAQGAPIVFAKQENTLVTPLEGIATTIMNASYEAVSLIEDSRRLVAVYERNIVSTALQSMRTVEDLKEISPVLVPTNDMARFPSVEQPLFPEYVDKRYSQFKYTLDSNGSIGVATSNFTDMNLYTIIEQLMDEWAGNN